MLLVGPHKPAALVGAGQTSRSGMEGMDQTDAGDGPGRLSGASRTARRGIHLSQIDGRRLFFLSMSSLGLATQFLTS